MAKLDTSFNPFSTCKNELARHTLEAFTKENVTPTSIHAIFKTFTLTPTPVLLPLQYCQVYIQIQICKKPPS